MNRIAASLAALLLAVLLGACGGSGAEPDAPSNGASPTLVLDFQPNAVHAGIYAALADGADLDVKVPGASTDAPKLLQAGRADLAVMDIQDLAIARERGADLVAVGALVQRPLAAVIAGDRAATRTPADLRGATVGVTGLPSDDAVLAAVLDSAGGDRGDPPETVTIGFDAISALSAGRVDAATAFWNVEGVALREAGVPTREFRVDDYGAPKFPELVLVTTRERLDADRERIASVVGELRDGYQRVIDDPEAALADELDAVPGLDEETLAAQLDALGGAFEPPLAIDRREIERWADYVVDYGIVEQRPDVDAAFDFDLANGTS
ncbi:MAG: ABC transporter substrate-binding protein [Solirubrobacterales bacterium]|nr:ABC transporter substrate-binding protein [Solirubrobacterales bacterium]MCB8969665.1 ABC transporter substrate-binding protein [Thermoleophilales bacterium]MCO5327940.1 ABC transporter substrate-binding protein [Solirubrobacterales bacterium]